MFLFRFSCVVVAATLGIAISIIQALAGNWLSAVSAFILGIVVGFVLLVGPWVAREFSAFNLAVGLVAILGLFAILHEHRAFDSQLDSARSEVMLAFASAGICRYSSNETRLLFEEGLRACGIQSYHDQADAVFRLQKSIYLPPEAALLGQLRDSVHDGAEDWCAITYSEASKLCPESFIGVSEKADAALRKSDMRRGR